MIEISSQQVDRVSRLLGNIPGGIQKAMYGTINRALNTVRAKSATEIARVYRISATDAKSAGTMKTSLASSTNLTGSIIFAGNVIPLIEFSVSYGQSGYVSAAVMRKSAWTPIKHAYVANLKYGTGVFERETKLRESSKQLYGPSMAHMMEHEDVLTKVEEAAQDTINKRIEQEISRILNGYGG